MQHRTWHRSRQTKSGGRSGAAVTTGAVLSIRRTKACLVLSPLAMSRTSHHVSRPAVSLTKVTEGFGSGRHSPAKYSVVPVNHPQFTVTLLRYQPLQSVGAGEQEKVSTGGTARAAPLSTPLSKSTVVMATAQRAMRAVGRSVGCKSGGTLLGRSTTPSAKVVPHLGNCQRVRLRVSGRRDHTAPFSLGRRSGRSLQRRRADVVMAVTPEERASAQ
jgi:hypothetical protein